MRESRERHLLYLGLLVTMIPVLLLRDFTPSNELRYLSIADEALRNHVFFAFTDHGAPFTDKPPLYIWIVMFCRWITGAHHMWLLGLFSLVPAVGIARVIDHWTRNDMDGQGRSMARLILLTSGIFFVSAVTIRMDMLMSLFIVLALREFWLMQSGDNVGTKCRWLFPLYVFLAVFTKGALGLVIPLCVTVVYLAVSGNIRHFFRYWGVRTWVVLLVLLGAWFACVYAEGGASYLNELVVNQTIDRTFDSTHHSAPFYYYLLTIWYILAPWSLLIVGIIIAALRPRFVRSRIQTFFLTASVTIFVVLSVVSSKLQIYMLPAVPFMVYTAVMFLPRFHNNKWIELSVAVPAAVMVLALPVLIWAAATFPDISYLNNGLLYAAATALSLCSANALYHLYNRHQPMPLIDVVRRIGWGIALTVFIASWALPSINADLGYGKLCKKARQVSRRTGITDIRAYDIYRAENMDAYLDCPIKVVDKGGNPTAEGGRFILLAPQAEAVKAAAGNEVLSVGPYAVVVFK